MKIIISDAKTISKTVKPCNDVKVENFSKETLEILKKAPSVQLSKDFFYAFYMYDGLCFKNIDRENLNNKDLEYVKNHLVILSALYGAVLPFDLIHPYRLDFLMKTDMGNLYKFWNDKIYKKVFKDENVIVNLSSVEFSKTIKKFLKDEVFLDIEFFENVDGNLKKHSTFLKKSRGQFLNFCIKEKIEKIEDLKKFKSYGFSFKKEYSSEKKYVFIKNDK